MNMYRVACLALAAIACACASEGPPAVDTSNPSAVPIGPGDGILFVGNSLTYANDLPGLVEGLAAGAGSKLQTASVAYAGFSLDDHLKQGDAARSIATGGWRVVILQQGPSSLDESRRLLRLWTANFDKRIRAVGARTALYSVWPDSAFPTPFGDVAESYSLAASDVGGIYLPVTDAWLLAWKRDPSLPLYSSDGFHPSEQGSYLAALVIVSVLTARPAVGMPARVMRPDGHELAIPADAAAVLQQAAAEAVAAYARP
ncbi:MAG TPA: SGNH/GDSL hydrolase family protein [Myxococcales bacterium]|nr:SGNH/GDSL hydrolase family protein [Myxococcales bacterium]